MVVEATTRPADGATGKLSTRSVPAANGERTDPVKAPADGRPGAGHGRRGTRVLGALCEVFPSLQLSGHKVSFAVGEHDLVAPSVVVPQRQLSTGVGLLPPTDRPYPGGHPSRVELWLRRPLESERRWRRWQWWRGVTCQSSSDLKPGLALRDELQLPRGVEIPFQLVRVRRDRPFVSGHGALAPDGKPLGRSARSRARCRSRMARNRHD